MIVDKIRDAMTKAQLYIDPMLSGNAALALNDAVVFAARELSHVRLPDNIGVSDDAVISLRWDFDAYRILITLSGNDAYYYSIISRGSTLRIHKHKLSNRLPAIAIDAIKHHARGELE